MWEDEAEGGVYGKGRSIRSIGLGANSYSSLDCDCAAENAEWIECAEIECAEIELFDIECAEIEWFETEWLDIECAETECAEKECAEGELECPCPCAND